MTTRTVERSRIKCGQYWPSDEGVEEEFGDFYVINNGTERRDSYIVSNLLLQNGKVGYVQKVGDDEGVSNV